jgi:cell wall assembly regulator SMI1
VGKWRTLFEANLPPHGGGEYVQAYEFGPPATETEFTAAEQRLGLRLPDDLREMLSEFNGVWRRVRTAPDPENWYLDLGHMIELASRQREVGWEEVFSEGELDKIVYVCAYDGLAQTWALCVEEVAGHPAGAVVYHDHDSTEFEEGFPSLAEFVRRGPK